MDKAEMLQIAGEYLIRLIGCALSGTSASDKPEGCAWEQVYALAKSNSVEGVSYFGVKSVSHPPEEPLLSEWKRQADMVSYHQLYFDEERGQIFAEMEEYGLSYLPLKGIRLAGYYPHLGMRSMADNDILYAFVEPCPSGGFQIRGQTQEQKEHSVSAAQAIMVDIMKRRGYRIESLKGNHDIFLKDPFYNFEMHRRLVSGRSQHYAYYQNPWKRAVQDKDNPFSYSFSLEDEYLYLLAHTYKHFTDGGCGIRCIVDQYVFMQKYSLGMDWDYLQKELKKLELAAFEKQMRQLAEHAFGFGEKMSEEDQRLVSYLLGCGTYGSMDIKVKHAVEKLQKEAQTSFQRAKWKYLWKRVFLPQEVCREAYPLFYRHRWLKTVLPLYRLIRGIVRHPKQLLRELRLLRRAGVQQKRD